MAASTSTAAHSNNNSCYDVFISHRGPDVKKTFASHLYRRLISYGLRVFLDYEELQEGEEFPCQIKNAIKTASVQIAIFSPKYADSKWCLDELLFMLESGAPIIPVFHGVEPTDLRRTQGEGVYAKSLRNLEKKRGYNSKTIENWRNALSRVADISGFDLKDGFNGDEGKLVDRLVEVVLKKGKKKLNVARYPTGLKEVVEDFETKISLQGFVGITGLGGVGKTTLAKELFNEKSSRYSQSCFLSDVRERARTSIPLLQRKLLKDLGASEEAIDSEHEGLGILGKHFSVLSDPVLLVLDDVDHHNQVHALLPVADKGIFPLPPSSLILITARDKNVLIRSGVQEPSIYKLTGLNTERSRELFCSHAFSQPHPMQGFEDLVNQFLKACNGLPLSLKVFGGLLYGKPNKSYWEDELEKLQKALPHEIQKSLQISYDALPREEQQIFLDIACFFIGQSRDTAIRVWKASGWNGSRGFENLLSKCLVELDIIVENSFDMYDMYERGMKYRIIMHDHLRDMGRYLANNTLGFPCRLWRGTKHKEDLLQQSSKATKVRGIRMLSGEHYCDERADSDSDVDNERASFSRYKMKNLQLLDVDMEEDHLKCLLDGMDSPNLLWFRWRNCPCSSLPPYIPMRKLWVLEVEGYNFETLWQEDLQTPFRLRELRIRVHVLHKIPKSIGQLKHLELMVVVITGDDVEIPREFCDLRSLKHLVLQILQLRSLPDSFGNLSSLQRIDLSTCRALDRLPDSFGDLSSLQHIDLSYCGALQRLPDSFGNLSKLEHINLKSCRALETLPDSFGDLWSLQHIDMSFCRVLKRLPDSFGNLSMLEHINLKSCGALERLPDSCGDLWSLQHIDLSYCGALERLPDSFGDLSSLQHIDMSFCRVLERLPDSFGDLSSLQHIDLSNCGALEMLPDSFGDLSSLQHIDLSYCGALEMLPDSFGNLSKLEHINLKSCGALERLPDSFGNLSKLEHINLSYCGALQRLPDSFGDLSSLQHIDLAYCDALERLPDSFRNLSKLEHINLEACGALERLPHSLTIPGGNFRKIMLEYMRFRRWRIEVWPPPPENAYEEFLEKLMLYLINMEEWPSATVESSHLERLVLETPFLEALPPSFGRDLRNLKYLELRSCQNLKLLPDSFGDLSSLQHIDMSYCGALEKLPDSFGDLSSLQHIDLSYCGALQRLPDSFGDLSKLEHINLENCRALERLPDSFGNLSKLEHINLKSCGSLERLPDSLGDLSSLQHIDMSCCGVLEKLPDSFGYLSSLQRIDLSYCGALERLPDSFGQLSKLEHINLKICGALERLPDSFGDLSSLQHIDLFYCGALERLPDSFGHLSNLEHINLKSCGALKGLPDSFGDLSSLQHIDLAYCGALERLPDSYGGLSSLQHIDLAYCSALDRLPDSFGGLSSLQHIDLFYCGALERLPDSFGDLSSLQHIDLSYCRALKRLPDSFGNLSSLQHIDLSYCRALERLPDSFGHLSNLEHINLKRCDSLERLPDSFGDILCLERMDLSFCGALERLPDSFGNLINLEYINLLGCLKLTIPRGTWKIGQVQLESQAIWES